MSHSFTHDFHLTSCVDGKVSVVCLFTPLAAQSAKVVMQAMQMGEKELVRVLQAGRAGGTTHHTVPVLCQ